MRAPAAPTTELVTAEQPAPAAPAPEQPAPAGDVDTLYPDNTDEPAEGATGEDADPAEGGEDPAPKGDGEDDAGEDTLSTVDQLLEQIQLAPEKFGNLKINVKVDGATSAVPVSELIKSYQIGEAATKRLEDAKIKAAALTSTAETEREAAHANLSVVAKLVKSAEDVLERDIKAIDWPKLRAEDPAEYAAKKDEVRDRRAEINSLKDQGKKAWTDAVAAQRDQARADTGEMIAEQKTKLLEAIPDWSDPVKAKAEIAQLTDYLVTKRGFTNEEVAGTIDHRLLVLARDAWRYQNLQSKTDVAKKKVAIIPKTLKPNSQGSPASRPKERTLLEDLYG